jgi:biotin carboxyl carrier protein
LCLLTTYYLLLCKMARLIFSGGKLELEQTSAGIALNGLFENADVKRLAENHFLVIKDQKSYEIHLRKLADKGKWQVKVNHKESVIELQDDSDLLLERLGMTGIAVSKHTEQKAPMPGLILEVGVKPGDKVQPGDVLVVLEAMKMENLLKASAAGVIEKVMVSKGDRVDKGQPLVRFV